MWWRFLACLIATAGVFAGVTFTLRDVYSRGRTAGWDARDAQALRASSDAQRRALMAFRASIAASLAADAQEASRAEKTRIVYRTIRESIPAHVTPEIDRRYPLPAGLVRVYDASLGLSAAGADATGLADDAPSAVVASRAAAIFTDNGEACRDAADRLTAFQDLVRGQPGYRGP